MLVEELLEPCKLLLEEALTRHEHECAAQEKAGAGLELLLDVLPDVIKRGALCKTQLQSFSPALDLHNLIMHNDCRFSSLSYDLHDLTTAHHFLSPPSWLRPKAASRILRPIGTADWEP